MAVPGHCASDVDHKTNMCCVVLFRTARGARVILTPEQASKFEGVIDKIRPRPNRADGKPIPEPYVFYYWTLHEANDDLIKHSITFNHRGTSVNWALDEQSTREIRQLIGQLMGDEKASP